MASNETMSLVKVNGVWQTVDSIASTHHETSMGRALRLAGIHVSKPNRHERRKQKAIRFRSQEDDNESSY